MSGSCSRTRRCGAIRGGQGDGRIDLTVGGHVFGAVEAVIIDRLEVGGSLLGSVSATTIINQLSVSGDVGGHIRSHRATEITVGGQMTMGAEINFLTRLIVGGDARGLFRFDYLQYPGLIDVSGDFESGSIQIRQEMVGAVVRVRKEFLN
jgi:hypothetical protein